jgi:WD40 repeat protein
VFTPDGRHFLSPGEDGEIGVWDVETMRPARAPVKYPEAIGVWTLLGADEEGWFYARGGVDNELHRLNWRTGEHDDGFKRGQVYWVAYDARRHRMAYLSVHGHLKLLDPRTGKERIDLMSLPQDGNTMDDPTRMEFDPTTGDLVVIRVDGLVRRWDGATGAVRYPETLLPGPLRTSALAMQGDLVVGGAPDGAVGAWRILREPASVHAAASGSSVATGTDHLGSLVCTRSDRGDTELRAVESLELKCRFGHSEDDPFAVSPDGNLIAFGGAHSHWSLWDRRTGNWRCRQAPLRSQLSRARFSPCGRFLLLEAQSHLWLYSVEGSATPKVLLTRIRPEGMHRDTVAAAGAFMYVGHNGALIWRREAQGWQTQWVSEPSLRWGTLAANGSVYAMGTEAGAMVYSLSTGRPLSKQRFVYGTSINRFSFTADGRKLAMVSDRQVSVWDVATHARIGEFRNRSNIERLVFDPSGRRLACVSEDGEMRVWDVETGVSLLGSTWVAREVNQLLFPNRECIVAVAPRQVVRICLPRDNRTQESLRMALNRDHRPFYAMADRGFRLTRSERGAASSRKSNGGRQGLRGTAHLSPRVEPERSSGR